MLTAAFRGRENADAYVVLRKEVPGSQEAQIQLYTISLPANLERTALVTYEVQAVRLYLGNLACHQVGLQEEILEEGTQAHRSLEDLVRRHLPPVLADCLPFLDPPVC